MAGWTKGAVQLPSTHVFVTLAWGRHQRTAAVPRWIAAAVLATSAAATLWMLGCTAYVLGHDSLLAAAMRRQGDMQYAYEDRIVALQRQLDRSTSQQAQLERTVGTRLDTLTAQEGDLRRRATTVAELGAAMRTLEPPGASTRASARPDAPAHQSAVDHEALQGTSPGQRAASRIAALTSAFTRLDDAQQDAMAGLQRAASSRLARLKAAIGETGLSLSRFGAGDAVGGPFVPLDSASVPSGFERASLLLRGTLNQAERLKAATDHIPLNKPLAGTPEVTSPFGARPDPFLGRPALHTGVDLRDDTGSVVEATAPGHIVFAGSASGYGNMVEIDHGAGLSTRYAHLSSITVSVGDAVASGDKVGLVGSTGRATGPHLHYETRIDGEPVDPMRFLEAGQRLAQNGMP